MLIDNRYWKNDGERKFAGQRSRLCLCVCNLFLAFYLTAFYKKSDFKCDCFDYVEIPIDTCLEISKLCVCVFVYKI